MAAPKLQSRNAGTPSVAALAPEDERRFREALAAAGYNVPRPPMPFHHTQLLDQGGDRDAALAAYAELLRRYPDDEVLLEGVAYLLQIGGRPGEAAGFRRRMYAARVRRMGVPAREQERATDFLVARYGGGSAPAQSPPAYVAALFDGYSETFDEHLVGELEYRAPELVRAAVDGAIETRKGDLDILDVGCGTGLLGAALRSLARKLEGVDLSDGMLAKAREREVYDRLEKRDLVSALGQYAKQLDVVAAADVLNYFGDLEEVFRAAGPALRTAGLFAFTLEHAGAGETRDAEPSDWCLRPTGRYVHSRSYVERLARATGFEVERVETHTLRIDDARPVEGLVVVLRRLHAPKR